MANTILHKRSTTAGSVPAASALSAGELALNTADGSIYMKDSAGSVVKVGQNFASFNGDIIPDVDNVHSLGSASKMWRDVYIGPGSLYVNGQKVIEEDSGTITLSADDDQNVQIRTGGGGDIEFYPSGTGAIEMKGSLSIQSNKNLLSNDGNPISCTVGFTMNGEKIQDMAAPTASTDAATKGYVDSQISSGFTLSDGTNSSTIAGGDTLTVNNGTGTTASIAGDAFSVSLAASGVTANSYGSSTAIPVLTVDAYGRITAASTATISTNLTVDADSGTATSVALGTDTLQILGGTGLSSAVTSDTVTVNLDNSGVTAGSYGSATAIPVLTVNAQGQITSASTTAVAGVSTFTWNSTTETLTIGTADGGSYSADISGMASEGYVDTAISNLIGGAPAALDTLNELAAAIGDDASYASSITTSLAGKVGTSSAQALHSSDALTSSGATVTLNKADGTSESVTVNNVANATTAASTSGNSATASKWATSRTMTVTGDVTGSVSFDGSSNMDLVTTFNLSQTHSDVYTATATDESNNASASRAITASTLGFNMSGAVSYTVYLNRALLRPDEVTVNTSNGTLTFAAGTLAVDDEIEAVWLS